KEVVQLQQRIANLEKKLTELAKAPDEGRAQPQARQARTPARKKMYDVPFDRIRSVLAEAKKDPLDQMKIHWPAFLEQLKAVNRPAHATIQDSNPVAASLDTVIVSFKYEIHCSLFLEHKEVVESILANSLAHHTIIPIPENDWHQLREQYIAEHEQEKDDTEEKPEVVDQLVDEAKKLFGEDMLEIHE